MKPMVHFAESTPLPMAISPGRDRFDLCRGGRCVTRNGEFKATPRRAPLRVNARSFQRQGNPLPGRPQLKPPPIGTS